MKPNWRNWDDINKQFRKTLRNRNAATTTIQRVYRGSKTRDNNELFYNAVDTNMDNKLLYRSNRNDVYALSHELKSEINSTKYEQLKNALKNRLQTLKVYIDEYDALLKKQEVDEDVALQKKYNAQLLMNDFIGQSSAMKANSNSNELENLKTNLEENLEQKAVNYEYFRHLTNNTRHLLSAYTNDKHALEHDLDALRKNKNTVNYENTKISDCDVCMESEPKIKLPSCTHYFCKQCISSLYNKSKKGDILCPLCRQVQDKDKIQDILNISKSSQKRKSRRANQNIINQGSLILQSRTRSRRTST